jgi:hypothetical protein
MSHFISGDFSIFGLIKIVTLYAIEQQRCSAYKKRCSIEQQSNTGETPTDILNATRFRAPLVFGVSFLKIRKDSCTVY